MQSKLRLILFGLAALATAASIDSAGWARRKVNHATASACAARTALPAKRAIRAVGEHAYQVDLRALQTELNGCCTGAGSSSLMSAFSRSARIVPDMHDGKANGLRLYAVKPDGLLDQLGFHNGDRVMAINDVPITSPQAALAIYADSAQVLSVTLERGAHPVTKVYTLQ